MNYEEAKNLLSVKGQEHLLHFYQELSNEDRGQLLQEISQIDWELLEAARVESGQQILESAYREIDGLGLADIAKNQEEYRKIGIEAIRSGKVAAVLLAGGQGSRLGSDAPKGMFQIGISRPLTIFEQLICNLREVCDTCRAYVPLYIMTSTLNDGATREFFQNHNYFGYPQEYIRFFVQEMAPCIDYSGKIMLSERGHIALSPNGNGGWYSSLQRANLTQDIAARGIEWLNVFAVDNVLQRIADPAFIGATIQSGKNSGAKVVSKSCPEERVGVLCYKNGRPSVIEYYELPEAMAHQRDSRGELVYRYGVILNYLFRVDRLAQIAQNRLPLHCAEKKIPYLNEEGRHIVPEVNSGFKIETLILDMIAYMGDCLAFEVEREREFAPVKNRTGVDSVESARRLLMRNGVNL